MYNGLWTIEFNSKENRYGRGILVIIKNRILGGDAGYYYVGTCKINDSKIEGYVNIIRYDRNSESIFGDYDHFQLIFSGQIKSENIFEAIGTMANNPGVKIRIIGTKKED